MPNPAGSSLPPINPKIGLMLGVADLLIPFFRTGSIDIPLARQMAASAIDAYHPETRADFVNVARTIAFSMTALALLGKAASGDLTMAEQMRAFGRANALNRSADQSERTMMQRRRYEQANPPAEEMGLGSEPPAPDPEFDDAAMQAAVAMKEYLTARAPAGIEAAAPEAPPKPAAVAPGITARRPPLSVNSLQPPIATPATAIHYGLQSPNDSQLRTKPDSEAPPRHRATQHVVEQSGARRAL